jgi:hypothetical protein
VIDGEVNGFIHFLSLGDVHQSDCRQTPSLIVFTTILVPGDKTLATVFLWIHRRPIVARIGSKAEPAEKHTGGTKQQNRNKIPSNGSTNSIEPLPYQLCSACWQLNTQKRGVRNELPSGKKVDRRSINPLLYDSEAKFLGIISKSKARFMAHRLGSVVLYLPMPLLR